MHILHKNSYYHVMANTQLHYISDADVIDSGKIQILVFKTDTPTVGIVQLPR